MSNAQLPKIYDNIRNDKIALTGTSNCAIAPIAFYSFSRYSYLCIDLDFEPRVFESISDRNTGSMNPRFLIFSWLSGELFAVNIKHYPSPQAFREEKVRAMKGLSAVWNWCSVDELSECFCRMVTYSVVSGLAGLWAAFANAADTLKTLFIINHKAVDLLNTKVLLAQLDSNFYFITFRVFFSFVGFS